MSIVHCPLIRMCMSSPPRSSNFYILDDVRRYSINGQKVHCPHVHENYGQIVMDIDMDKHGCRTKLQSKYMENYNKWTNVHCPLVHNFRVQFPGYYGYRTEPFVGAKQTSNFRPLGSPLWSKSKNSKKKFRSGFARCTLRSFYWHHRTYSS
jgi:hypothetical protein